MKALSLAKVILPVVLFLLPLSGFAQNRADRQLIKRLKTHITYLSSDELEGRATGSAGETLAAQYLIDQYREMGIPAFRNAYLHPFDFVHGREILRETQLTLNKQTLSYPTDYFPMPFSANTTQPVHGNVLPEIMEQQGIWLVPLYSQAENANNPHWDYEKEMFDRAIEARTNGAIALIFYANLFTRYPPVFHKFSAFETLDIPVFFLSYPAYQKYFTDRPEGVSVQLNSALKKVKRTGTNTIAIWDNQADYTVVIGAHYDHLGFGKDGGSLSGKRAIHNGADDNASGTAGVLELARKIKKSGLKNYNYIFAHFSGEELGLLGSKAFVKKFGLDSTQIAYMINMDMIGRLKDSTRVLTLGGVGTSPLWSKVVKKGRENFQLQIDSSGIGPSDHTSFYQKGIPVLFFFTGIHRDYHKPSDDAEKINYRGEADLLNYIYAIVAWLDEQPKPKFTPTSHKQMGGVRFKVTLGIMPDYIFQGEGLRIEAVSEDRPAQHAGLQSGDVIIELGNHPVKGIQSYMEALGAFENGQTVKIKVVRDGKTLIRNVTF